jgi:metallophosphoesterase superfamily enzyme
MEAIGIGDLHLTDDNGTGGLAKYVEEPDRMVCDEIRTVLRYAESKNIREIIQYGDVCQNPRMSYDAMLSLYDLLSSNPQFKFRIITGNHDQYGETPETGHSLQILQKMVSNLDHVRIYTKPVTVRYGKSKTPVRFLPYPSEDFDSDALNIFHKEVYGCSNDAGRVHKDDHLSKSKAIVCAGHIHTAHRVRNTYYSGTLYQTNFGEKLPKYFHHIEFNSPRDYEINLIEHDPKYKLHNVVLQTRDDLASIPQSKHDLVKLVIQDGCDVSGQDYAHMPNVVECKNFRNKDELKAVLLEDLTEGKEMKIQTEEFFQSWLEALDCEPKMRERVTSVRARVLEQARN